MKTSFILLFSMFLLSATAQQSEDKIFWTDSLLSWDNFQAKPDRNSPFQANTNAGLSYSWGIKSENGDVNLKYEVKSYFNPNRSWVVPESRGNDYLLSHEQVHFDITELHARKLRKSLSEINVKDLPKDPGKDLNRLYEVIEKERAAMQLNYDSETKHSLDSEAQARWEEYIRKEIRKYDNYNI